jgi:hypothetical protein
MLTIPDMPFAQTISRAKVPLSGGQVKSPLFGAYHRFGFPDCNLIAGGSGHPWRYSNCKAEKITLLQNLPLGETNTMMTG